MLMMLMMLAGRSENRRRDYGDDCRFLRHLPSESMTMMLMLVLSVRDHLWKAIVRLASSYPRALFNRAGDGAFLDRMPAKTPSGQHGTTMCLEWQRPQASTIDIASWFEVAQASEHHPHHRHLILVHKPSSSASLPLGF